MSRVDAKYLELLRAHYRAVSKKEKGVILDEFVKTTGYGRKYAIAVLTAKRDYVKGPVRRPRMTTYTGGLIQPLLTLHELFDRICSKRLRAALDVELPRLYDSGSLQVSSEIYEKLMHISTYWYATQSVAESSRNRAQSHCVTDTSLILSQCLNAGKHSNLQIEQRHINPLASCHRRLVCAQPRNREIHSSRHVDRWLCPAFDRAHKVPDHIVLRCPVPAPLRLFRRVRIYCRALHRLAPVLLRHLIQ